MTSVLHRWRTISSQWSPCRRFSVLLAVVLVGCLLLVGVAPLSRADDHQHQLPPQGAAQHRFDDIEWAVKMFEGAARDAWQKPDEVVAQLQLRPGDVVADIGAGTGYFTRRFAAAVGPTGQAMGLDVEPTMVAYMTEDAQKRGLSNYSARQVQRHDPHLAPRSVDVIFLCNTYHHIADRTAYVRRRLAPALKVGGRVVVVDFHKKPLPLGPPLEWKLAAETVTEEFRQAGFQLARSVDFLPYQYFLEFTLSPQGQGVSGP